MSDFMTPDVFHDRYYSVETEEGIVILPCSVAGTFATMDDLDEAVPNHGHEELPEVQEGWLYRLSAAGHMDCTDWSVADSEAEAYAELLDMYGNEYGEPHDWEVEAVEKAGRCPHCRVSDARENGEFCSDNCWTEHLEQEGPQEGDITTEDYCTFYQDGKKILELDPDDDHVEALRAHMEAGNWFPNCFVISDHGNVSLMDLSTSDKDRLDAEVTRLVGLAAELGVPEDTLDEMVHDMAQEADIEELNGLYEDDEQEEHIAACEEVASEVNNYGFEAQIRFLVECGVDVADIESALRAAKVTT